MMDQNNPSSSATPVTPPPAKSGDDNLLAGQIIPDPSATAPTAPTTPASNDPMSAMPQPSTVSDVPAVPVTDTVSAPTTTPVMPSSLGMGANALDSMSGATQTPTAAAESTSVTEQNPVVEPTTVPTPLDMPVSPAAESASAPVISTPASDPAPMTDVGTGLNAYVSTQKSSLPGADTAPVAAATDPLNITDNSKPQPTTNPLADSAIPAMTQPETAPTLPPSAAPAMDLPSAGTMSGSAPSSFVLDYNKPQSTASTADVPAAPQSELATTIPPIAEDVALSTPVTGTEPTPSNVLNDIGVGVDPTDSTEVGTEMKLDLNASTPDPVSTALPGVVEMPGPAIGSQPSNVAPLEQGLDTVNMEKGADTAASQPDIGLNQTITNMVTNENQSPLSQPQAVVQPEKKKSGKVFVMFSLILVVVVVALVLIMVGLNFIG